MAEGYKDWSAGDILTAADLEDYTVKQSVMVFADAAARTSALSSVLREGMVSYLKDTDSTEVYDGSAWSAVGPGKILQVVSTTKTDTFSTSSTSFTAVTGLSAAITPSATTSKVLVFLSMNYTFSTGTAVAMRMMRDSTAIQVGDAAGSRKQATMVTNTAGGDWWQGMTGLYLDSPSTTSATTYSVQIATFSGQTFYLNQMASNTDGSEPNRSRTASTITVMEVSA